MFNKVHITDLIPEEDTVERRRIYSSIYKKLVSHGITMTKTMKEAAYVIILFTRSYLKHHLDDIMDTIPNLGIGHSFLFCDDFNLPPGEVNLYQFARFRAHLDLDKFVNPHDIEDSPEQRQRVFVAFHKAIVFARTNYFIMPGGGFLPNDITDLDSLINIHVHFALESINPLHIDKDKLVGMEHHLLKAAALISKNVDTGGDTEVVIICGGRDTHDMTTITKFLTIEQFQAKEEPGYHCLHYADNCPEEDPDTFTQSILCDALRPNPLDLHINFPNKLHMYHPVYRFLIALDGINSINQVNGVSSLVDALNRAGTGNRVVLWTGLDLFRDYKINFQLPDSVHMGFIGESTSGRWEIFSDQTAGWRPFCLLLHPSQFSHVMKVVKEGGVSKDASKNVAEFQSELKVQARVVDTMPSSIMVVDDGIGHSKRFKRV